MMNDATEEKLRMMKLTGMLAAWNEQRGTPKSEELAFDERFGLIVDAEELCRETRRLGRTLKQAKLKVTTACVEGIEYAVKRGLDRAVIRQIATCRWVTETQNIAISGATGTGKTYLACAFAHQACRKGYRSLYRRMPALFQELRLARADGTHPRLMARLARLNVLVIDDFGIAPLSDFDRQDLLELLRPEACACCGPCLKPAVAARPRGLGANPRGSARRGWLKATRESVDWGGCGSAPRYSAAKTASRESAKRIRSTHVVSSFSEAS